MFILCALHGVEASLLSKGCILELRAAVLRAVWSRRQPLAGAGAVLGMLDGPQRCDPFFLPGLVQVQVVWVEFSVPAR